MNAKVVYQVAKALPKVEQIELLNMLQKELGITSNKIKTQKKSTLTKGEAFQYLLKNVFNKKD